ncbi:MAG TPA: hypothetical protein VKV20_08095 [Ktedonobacteraceae bacterium]|jgi:exonuclease VII small subunit|nr:hypothetical protein [Ktedonobacteraceae bacterium]
MILFSHINKWIAELERLTGAYEAAVDEVEALMDQLERDTASQEHWFERVRQDREIARRLQDALETAEQLAQRVRAANAILSDALETTTIGLQLLAPRNTPSGAEDVATPPPSVIGDTTDSALPDGTLILQEKYRIVQLLHTRPRLHLYLAQRLPGAGAQFIEPGEGSEESYAVNTAGQQQSLVAVRELVLTGLPPQIRQQIERAAFEEFVSPMLLGSPRLPGTGDRMRIENNRHYLIMQLRPARGQKPAVALTLAELLRQRQWPTWLDMETALDWSIQLSRIVARLHHLGAILGDLNPATVLVDARGAAEWAPVLLVSWPPAPQFWPSKDATSPRELYTRIFPLAAAASSSARANAAFAAPETLAGICDERSDVYSLGAILYLLLTHYAPVRAALRQRAEQEGATTGPQKHAASRHSTSGGIALIPPHLLNQRLSPPLEDVLLRALALDPAERYASAFELVEALEALASQDEPAAPYSLPALSLERKAPRVTKVLEWLKHEMNA